MSELNRLKGSKGLTANIGYEGTEVVNDFDSKYPWNEMKIITAENGDKFIQIPKFYVHYIKDEDGYITGREFSLYKVDNDWLVNNVFIKDGQELPYVEIGCYLADLDSDSCLRSRSGAYPKRGIKLEDARTYILNNNSKMDDGYEYQLFDIWCANLLQDLFVVEFAQSDASEIMSGYTYTYYSGSPIANGQTDSVEYVTGMTTENSNKLGNSLMKYRGIENLYGGGQTVLDKIVCDRGRLTVEKDGEAIVCGQTAPTSSGIVRKLKQDSITGLVFPSYLHNNGKYIDVYTGADEDNQMFLLGRNNASGSTLFCYTAYPKSDAPRYGVYRIIRRPKTY